MAAVATGAVALGGCTAYAGTGTAYPRGYYGSGPYYGGGHYYSSYPRTYGYGPRVQRYQPYVHQAPPAYRPYVAPPAYRR